VTISAGQKILATSLEATFAVFNSSALTISGVASLCYKQTGSASFNPFLLAPVTKGFDIPPAVTGNVSFTSTLAAAQPSAAGTYQVGLCAIGSEMATVTSASLAGVFQAAD
jgi:hypothetical protein